MAAIVYPIPMRVPYSDLSRVRFAIVTAGKDTNPPVTKQNVALMAMSPPRSCVKRQKKRIMEVARQQGTRTAMPPYLGAS